MQGMKRLLEIMARLRDPERGCEWDLAQTFETIAPYTLEEAYEVDDAIRRGDLEGLRDELGDLLLQVVFHARMAEEAGHFDFASVVAGLADKLVRRHPHVFGDVHHENSAERGLRWEDQKAAERAARAAGRGGAEDPFDGVPRAAPALSRAVKLRKRAARRGWQEPDDRDALARALEQATAGALEALSEPAAGEKRLALGNLLGVCARMASAAGIDAERALRDANEELEREMRADMAAASDPERR